MPALHKVADSHKIAQVRIAKLRNNERYIGGNAPLCAILRHGRYSMSVSGEVEKPGHSETN
jgi:hypothetical protein